MASRPGTCENFKTKHKSHNAIPKRRSYMDISRCFLYHKSRNLGVAWTAGTFDQNNKHNSKLFDSVSFELLSNGWDGCVRSL